MFWSLHSLFSAGEWFRLKRMLMHVILSLRALRQWRQRRAIGERLYDRELARKWRESEAPQQLKDDPFVGSKAPK